MIALQCIVPCIFHTFSRIFFLYSHHLAPHVLRSSVFIYYSFFPPVLITLPQTWWPLGDHPSGLKAYIALRIHQPSHLHNLAENLGLWETKCDRFEATFLLCLYFPPKGAAEHFSFSHFNAFWNPCGASSVIGKTSLPVPRLNIHDGLDEALAVADWRRGRKRIGDGEGEGGKRWQWPQR